MAVFKPGETVVDLATGQQFKVEGDYVELDPKAYGRIAPGAKVSPVEAVQGAQQAQQAPAGHVQLPAAPSPSTKPDAPQSLTSKILDYGKTAAGMALPVAGGLAGGALGLMTPIPGGLLGGEILGSVGGEALAQGLGLSEPSATQLALSAASPVGGRLLGAAGRALPITRSGAVRQLRRLLPPQTSEEMFGKLPKLGLTGRMAEPLALAVLSADESLIKATPSLQKTFDKLTSKTGITFEEAEILKNDLQGLANSFSRLSGDKYNPALAREYSRLRDILVHQLDKANPGYAKALEHYGREQNVARLKHLFEASPDPVKDLKRIATLPISDLTKPQKLIATNFTQSELEEIQSIASKLWPSLRDFTTARILGAGLVGGVAGGYHSGMTYEATAAGALAAMLAYPAGRRMLGELVKSKTYTDPSKLATTLQIFRAISARQPGGQSTPQPTPTQSQQGPQ